MQFFPSGCFEFYNFALLAPLRSSIFAGRFANLIMMFLGFSSFSWIWAYRYNWCYAYGLLHDTFQYCPWWKVSLRWASTLSFQCCPNFFLIHIFKHTHDFHLVSATLIFLVFKVGIHVMKSMINILKVPLIV